ncbi:protein TIME FOR COFFEE-like isoform X2 [Cucurbita moschata]|uniref:Protein TIME FOR COFFEE-like isoform X2 n=1 Tax=Cucurbita moschata TaxID=3662 RepID=A0A6J1EWE3_CUCMO|nr:protein TIME FOR COFFEE-like isoform X2 [Cucurbita moschata]
MDRNREARRTTTNMAASNGLSRRRYRSSSLRDSPEDDGPLELQDTVRLRDRGSGKKDRDRDRDRDRLSRSKRRRADRLIHGGNNREDGGEDSSEESVNDEEDDEDDDGGGAGGASVRMLPPNPATNLNHRKSYPPAKSFRAAPPWKPADEMIGVSVPRKARSASTKRSHECWPAAAGGGMVTEAIHRQASTSPVRPPSLTAMATLLQPPASPSSSNASKQAGPKLRPPKSSSKPSSMAQDEIEIEIAEVLYGMMRQPQAPPKQEADSVKFDPKSAMDAKSRVSSPISNPSSVLPQNSSSSVTPISATAPKRKRPRPVKYDDENMVAFNLRNSPVSSTAKPEAADQPTNTDIPSTNVDKVSGSAGENGVVSNESGNSQALPATSESHPEALKVNTASVMSNSKPLTEESEGKVLGTNKEEPQSPLKESNGHRLEDKREDMTATKSSTFDVDNQRDDKYKIDLMAPPLRASPERDGEIDFVAVDAKPMVIDVDTEMKPLIKEEDKGTTRLGTKEVVNVESKAIAAEEGDDSKKPIVCKDGKVDLQLDLEKTTGRDCTTANVVDANKFPQYVLKHPPPQLGSEKAGSGASQASSLPLPMSLPGWPSGLPPMGYVAPLPGVVSVDGSALPTAAMQPPNLLFHQPRLKRCATHFYIARNILYHQQIARMNPFWPAAAGSASLFGPKHGNLSIVPSADVQGNLPKNGKNAMLDKGQSLGMFSGHAGKDRGSQAVNVGDGAQRRQILLQQALPPGAPSNILHGPAFILPLSQQQQAAVATSVRPVSVKSPPPSGNANGSVVSNSSSVSTSAVAAIAAPAMSFNYSGVPGNEPQYLAILQNNGYTYPIPAHVGAPPPYRGTHTHSMPFFNGSFYSSQMLHPSQLQQQQPPPQSHPHQQGLQNANAAAAAAANGSSSSQKNLSNQQQRPHGSTVSGNFQGFPASRNQPSHSQQQNHASHQTRPLESEIGGEDSPSTADSRMNLANLSVYGPNFPMPMHTPNFALMTPASMAAAGGGAPNDKKQQPQQQPQGSKGLEPSQTIALSFAPPNGAPSAPGLDLSSISPNHPIFQSIPEITRQGYQHIMAAAAAAQAAQQKKIYRVAEEGKTVHTSAAEDERKNMSVKTSPTVGQSIAFSRPDLAESTIPAGAAVVDSSARTLRTSGSVMPSAMGTVNMCGSQHPLQRSQQQQQQQQQMIQLQKQQQYAAAVARTKTSATSNGNVYAEHPPTSMAAKFPNALSSFSQNLVQSNSNSPAQSPQWKNSVRTTTSSQVPTPSLSSSNTSSIKNLPQQQGRPQQNHSQISFAANQKSTTQSQGQQPASSNQSPSPGMIGSPTNSSMSKGAGGSPRTATSSSMGHKVGQSSSLSSQQTKNPTSMPPQKSSPVGGRNVTSILGNNQVASSNSGTKLSQHPQSQQQQQQQHLAKQTLQQAQLLFPYMQAQFPHSSSTATASPSHSRRRPEQQAQGSGGTSSNGMLSLVHPVTIGGTTTTDPAKAVAAAAAAAANAANMKAVGGLPTQAILHPAQFATTQSSGNPHQLVPAGFPYVHTAAVQVKSTEQKQPAGG